MRRLALTLLATMLGCGSSDGAAEDGSGEATPEETGGSAGHAVSGVGGGGAGTTSSNGRGGPVGGSGGSTANNGGAAGGNGARDGGSALTDAGNVRPPPDPCIEAGTCQPGVWMNVTPANANLTDWLACANYGTLSAQVNAMHPETMYTQFNCQGVWKSTDYGLTWKGPINTGANAATVSDCAGGIAVPPKSASATVYMACIRGAALGFWSSANGGVDWTKHDVAPGGARQDFYPPSIDPYDDRHLLMEGHEMNVLAESVNGGESWTPVVLLPEMQAGGGTGALVFIDMGEAASTRRTWLYLPQGSGGKIGTWRTTDGGKTWKRVDTNEKEHSYYQIYQPDTGGVVFMAGIYSSLGYGVLRSTDYGQTWAHVGLKQNENIVFGTPKRIYAMDAYTGQKLEVADQPGTGTWTSPGTPAAMEKPPGGCPAGYCGGAVQAAVTSDGNSHIILTANWNAGLWRYVEPVK